MLNTALNYLPVIEEEVCSKKTTQSQSQKSSSGGEPTPEDESSSSEDLFHAPCSVAVPTIEITGNAYRHSNDRFYPPLPQDCDTPPRLIA